MHSRRPKKKIVFLVIIKMDTEFYNSYNKLFYSQDEFNRIYRMVENNDHRSDSIYIKTPKTRRRAIGLQKT